MSGFDGALPGDASRGRNTLAGEKGKADQKKLARLLAFGPQAIAQPL